MALLNEQVQAQVKQVLDKMTAPVKMIVFTQGEGGALECEFCAEMRQLAEELAALSDKITLQVLDFVADAAIAGQYRVDKIPAMILLGGGPTPKDYGIRLYGIPSGYEFGLLLEELAMVGSGEHGLLPKTLEALKRLTAPVHIQVFVTPT